ncbi:VAN3-binding protein [Typha angustifolia]|uniref:VAN3-binding protein n=1 Tax=Typha angustifolia TaxID=59011 RepID=UPI003C2D32EE
MDLDVKFIDHEASLGPMDLLSSAWCSSAIQVLQPKAQDCLLTSLTDKPIIAYENEMKAPSLKSNHSLVMDEGGAKSIPQWKYDDLKSWIWLQKAIHPELDYDLCSRKKWLSRKFTPWSGISIKKWVKEIKQKRKEAERLQRAEVHAAISVAGVAAALAAIASEKNADPNQPNSLKEAAVASAAALVAAQCVQVAESVGAKREQITSAISAAMTSTDANNIVTLTAAAATSLRGAATLRGRPGHREKIKGNSPTLVHDEFELDFGRCRTALAKGDEILVATPDGKFRLRTVSATMNRDGQILLKVKKINMIMSFSSAKESIIYDLHVSPPEKPIQEDATYSIDMTTSKGKIELKVRDYMQYKKWVSTINHMLMLSKTFTRYELPSTQ